MAPKQAAAAVADLPVVPVEEPWVFDWNKRFTKPDLVRLADLLGAPDMSRFNDEEILKRTLHAELAAILTNCLRLLHESKTQGEQDSNTADDEHNQAVLPEVMAEAEEPEEHDHDEHDHDEHDHDDDRHEAITEKTMKKIQHKEQKKATKSFDGLSSRGSASS